MQKQIVSQMLPAAVNELIKEIDEEIEEADVITLPAEGDENFNIEES